jgi:hypothetical protein
MFVEKLIKKEEGRMHNFEFLRGGGRFSPFGWSPPSLLSFFLYPRKP